MSGKQHRPAARLLVVPGLRDSGSAHWQTWLERQQRGALRVRQDDWLTPDLERWARRIGETLDAAGDVHWLVAAHSFGCLALTRYLALRPEAPIVAALLVAPADPDKFGVTALLPRQALPVPSLVVASETDPWMSLARAQTWAGRWGSPLVNLGDAGHINAESGFGPLPLARRWVTAMTQRLEHSHRLERADIGEWSFAV